MWPFLHPETVSQNSRSEWDAVSACGSGNSIPLRSQIPGCIFRQSPQPETVSHSKGKFWDALSETPSIRKARPTLHTSSECTRARLPERFRHQGDGKYHPQTLATVASTSVKKASRTSRLSHLYCFARRTTNGEATLPARPSWRLRPCCPGLPWWDGPLQQPSYRAAS